MVNRDRRGSGQPTVPFRRHERRATVRFPVEIAGSCEPLAARRGEGWEATVRDISRGGLSLHCERRFERGTLLLVELRTESCPVWCLMGRVQYVLRVAKGGWVL